MSLMKDLVEKFTMRKKRNIDSCAGTCSIAKECMLSDAHFHFDRRNTDSEMLRVVLSGLPYTFASQVLNSDSDKTGGERIRAAARAFKENMAALSAHGRATAEGCLQSWMEQR